MLRIWRFSPLAAVALLGGCASTPTTNAVASDPGDICGPQVTVFVAAGDVFGSPPRRQGPPTPADLAQDLARENAELERLQIAFDALLYCRWTEVRVIRADAASGRLSAPAASVQLGAAGRRLRRDLTVAREVRARIGARSARLEAALEQAAPGMRALLLRERATREAATRALASAPVVLRLRPDQAAPEVGRIPAGQEVSLRPSTAGFSFVDAGSRGQGYAQAGAFTVLPQRNIGAASASTDPLRVLAASNLSRRENFSESLDLAVRAADEGFERQL